MEAMDGKEPVSSFFILLTDDYLFYLIFFTMKSALMPKYLQCNMELATGGGD